MQFNTEFPSYLHMLYVNQVHNLFDLPAVKDRFPKKKTVLGFVGTLNQLVHWSKYEYGVSSGLGIESRFSEK